MVWTGWVFTGSLSGALAVALGAFAAHFLKMRLDSYELSVFETGVRYHMYHTFAIFMVAMVASRLENSALSISGFAFLGGILLFSGSLYALALTGHRWLGAITPFGGGLFLVGWFALAYSVYRAGQP